MATSKTRRELVLRALDVLGVSAVGQAPAAEDYSAVDAQVDPVLAMLAATEIVYVAEADDLPFEWFEPLANILADAMAVDFGLGDAEKATLGTNAAAARASLKLMTRGKPTGQRMVAEYF